MVLAFTKKNKRPVAFITGSLLVAAFFVAVFGSPKNTGEECRAVEQPTSAKQAEPEEKVTLGQAKPIVIEFGHNRGTARSGTTFSIKGSGIQEGPVRIETNLLARTEGRTADIPDEAIVISAQVAGNRLKVILCIDTGTASGIEPGTYRGTAYINDARFAEDTSVPIEVRLQSRDLYRLGAPVVLGALIGGVWLAGVAAGKRVTTLSGGQRVAIVTVIAAALIEFSVRALNDQDFGTNPLTEWPSLAWRVGAAALASATIVFAGEKAIRKDDPPG